MRRLIPVLSTDTTTEKVYLRVPFTGKDDEDLLRPGKDKLCVKRSETDTEFEVSLD